MGHGGSQPHGPRPAAAEPELMDHVIAALVIILVFSLAYAFRPYLEG